MRTFLVLWRRELAAYFLSPIAYVVALFFLVIMGFSFWFLVAVLVQGEAGVTVMNELFGSIFFWLATLTVTPLLTMRLVAEEKRSGTLETLMTAPVTDAAVILAKFAGALTFYLLIWLPTLSYALVLRRFSPATAPLDLGPMLGGYLGAWLIGSFYLAVGVFCSTLTRNQIVAAITCFALITLAFVAGFLPFFVHDPRLMNGSLYFSSVMHMLDFSRGAVDTRPMVLYVSGTALLLFAAVKGLESRRWK